jgi:hypothetical protein
VGDLDLHDLCPAALQVGDGVFAAAPDKWVGVLEPLGVDPDAHPGEVQTAPDLLLLWGALGAFTGGGGGGGGGGGDCWDY